MAMMVSSDSSSSTDATQLILDRLAKTKNNAEFLATLNKEI
jgi:transcription termination factor Rho